MEYRTQHALDSLQPEPARTSGQGNPDELALANLKHDHFALFHRQSLVSDLFPVDAHAALLDHPQGLGSAGHELRFLEYFRDRELGDPVRGFSALVRNLHRDLRNILGQVAALEARLEIGYGRLGGPGAVEARYDLARKEYLDVARVPAVGDFLFPLVGGLDRLERKQLDVAPHQLVRNRHQLPENSLRRLVDPDIVTQGFRHFLRAVQALEERHRENALLRLAVVLLQLASDQEIELLVRSSELDVGFHRDRIVALHERIEKLVDCDRLAGGIALGEVVAF